MTYPPQPPPQQPWGSTGPQYPQQGGQYPPPPTGMQPPTYQPPRPGQPLGAPINGRYRTNTNITNEWWFKMILTFGTIFLVIVWAGSLDLSGAGFVFLAICAALFIGLPYLIIRALWRVGDKRPAPPQPHMPVGPPPGWYLDPAGSGNQRWWNGAIWTDAYQPPTSA